MNKTIIININGIVFHIEEDAYEILKQYMTDVKRHFLDSEDSFEITSDIENRIAEMFNEILAREAKQVIVGQDVKAVIEQMGTVEDFEHAEDDTQPIKNAGAFTYKTASRRLFRDPDDHLVAGVCAGIANYFDISTLWIRLLFGLSFILFGSGFFLYLVLWVVIPRAVSRADRMAMKGEKLDLQGFKKNFEDEVNTVRGHVTDFGRDAKPFIYKSRDFIGDFFDHLGAFLGGTGKILLKLLGVMILLTCFGFGVALIVGIVAFFAFGNMDIVRVFPFNIVDKQYNALFFISAFLLLALPLLTIALLTIRMVFQRESFTKSSGFTILILWLGALSMVIYFSAGVAADFRSSAGFSQTVSVKPTANNTYYLKLNQARFISAEDSIRLNIKDHFGGKVILDAEHDDNDEMEMNAPRNMQISIERSDVAQPVLEERFTARGHSYADALMNARYTSYQFAQVDSVLKFDRHLRKQINRPWRDQEIKLVLRVPLNAILVIDEDMNRYLDNVDVYQCERDNKLDGDRSVTSARFIMTATGLQCKIDTLVTIPVTPKP